MPTSAKVGTIFLPSSPICQTQFIERLQWIDHPELGRVVLPHSPLVFEGTARKPIQPSLPLGAGNAAVFGEWLGHTPEELAAYKAKGVIS